MLIEAMVAIVVFSLGILAIIGLQATSTQYISDAKYRVDAANLVEQLISQMWSEDHTASTLASKYGSAGGSGYTTWKSVVASRLPGVTGNLPSVTIEADSSDTKMSTVTVVVYWQPPGSSAVHNYTAVSRIR